MKIRTLGLMWLVFVSAKLGLAQDLPQDFVVENAVSGKSFQTPVGIAFAPDGRLFVAEKRGRVHVVEDGVKLETPFIQLEDEILNIGDLGLLGIAVDPNFWANRYVYLLYIVDPDADGVDDEVGTFGRLTRYQAKANNPNQADLSTRRVLIGQTWPEGIPVCHLSHSVGSLRFGTDGTLLVSTGDGASFEARDVGGQTPDCFGSGRFDPAEDIGRFRAETIRSLSGKILRIDPETGLGLPSNPYFTGDPADTESKVWVYGLRNPFRFDVRPNGSTKPADGRPGSLFIGDVGEGKFEDLEVATTGGENFSWPCLQGPQGTSLSRKSKCSTGSSRNPAPKQLPFMTFHHDQGNKSSPQDILAESIIGGTFYTGSRYPEEYRGGYFFGDFVNGWIKVLKVNAQDEFEELLDFTTIQDQSLVDFQADPVSGDIHYVNIREGKVYRFRYTGFVENSNEKPVALASASPTSGPIPLTVHFKGSDSFDPDGDPLSFDWQFGDGGTSGEADPVHTYDQSGTYTVELTVSDDKDARSKFFLQITPGSTPPVATILKPVNGSSVAAHDLIFFEGIAEDADEPESNLNYTWEVLLHHNDHTHPQFFNTSGRTATFSAGEHGDPDDFVYVEAELHVTDSQGLSDTARVFVVLEGEKESDITASGKPIALIEAPSGSGSADLSVIHDSVFPAVGDSVPLLQYDTFSQGETRPLDWIGYEFPEEHRFNKLIFQEGIHFDNGGWFDSIAAQVRHDGIWEDVTNFNIVVPYAGNNGVNYETYTLLFGPKTGNAIRVIGIAGGEDHFISVAELRVFKTSIEEPEHTELEFHPVQDTFVWSAKSERNYGPDTQMRVRRSSSADQIAYLKFELNGFDEQVSRATLRLHVQEGGREGGSVYHVSNGFSNSSSPWTEGELTWNNAPLLETEPLSSVAEVETDSTGVFDVTAAVQSAGVYSFAIKSRSNDVVKYGTKESPDPPHLVIEFVSDVPRVELPSILSFRPARGKVGTEVEIIGEHLSEVVEVTFNGSPASDFEAGHGHIHAIVPESATTGRISVTTLAGVATSDADFLVESELPPLPVLTRFAPESGTVGTEVTVHGLHFNTTQEVRFNGIIAKSFTVESDSVVVAKVPSGAHTGRISVVTETGTGTSSASFSVLAGETELLTFHPSDDAFVWSKKPTSNRGDGEDLRVRKTREKQFAFLKFSVAGLIGRVVHASLFLFVNDRSDDGGEIYVVSNDYGDGSGPWNEAGIHWNNAPPIIGDPIDSVGEVKAGTVVEFDVTAAMTGNGPLSFGIKNASFNVVRYDSKEAQNPPALVIKVESDPQPAPPPVLSSFTPTAGSVGTEVKVIGQNLTETAELRFGQKLAPDYSVQSDTSLIVQVPLGAKTSKITVSTSGGSARSQKEFIVETLPAAVPILLGFDPSQGLAGTDVTIQGRHFTGATSLRFGDEEAIEFSVDSDSLIFTVVPQDAGTGKIHVTTPAGVATSDSVFLVLSGQGGGTFTLTPIHDSFVWSKKRLNNYGNSKELRVRRSSSAHQIAYFKFDVTGLEGPVVEATLRLTTTVETDDGGSVYVVSNNYDETEVAWDEIGINWPNSPRIQGSALSSAGSAGKNDVVEFDVTAAIIADAIYSFAVKQESKRLAKYSSKEGEFSPELVIKTGSQVGLVAVPEDNAATTNLIAGQIPLPDRVTLGRNYPNPFNLETAIEYSLPSPSTVRLLVFNLRGQEVRRLVDGFQSAGFKIVRWNGRDNAGREVASGVYVVFLWAGDQAFSEKMILQK